MKNIQVFLLFAMCCLILSACDSKNSEPKHVIDTFVLNSSEMSNGKSLPTTYTCDGDGVSPPLNWHGAPEGTQYYALIMHHNAPDGVHWYWTMFNIGGENKYIKSGEILGKIGTNSVNNLNEYAPPCSKGPGEKVYTYTVYALSGQVTFDDAIKVDRAKLLSAINNITLASAKMEVSFQRSNTAMNQRDGNKKSTNNPGMEPRPKPKQFKQPDLSINIDSSRCTKIRGSIQEAGFDQSVSVTCDENYAYVTSSTYPEHELMTGITGTNEQIPVPEDMYSAPIKLAPSKADTITTIDAAVGVAVNGVPIYDYSSQGELDVHQYDVKHDTLALGQLDICGGHSGRGDDYHYHVSPTCMIDAMKNKKNDAIIGWAYDGYPLYGNKNPDGSVIKDGELDVCHGQADDTFGYRYQTSATPPYIIQCLVGEVDTSILPRVAPLSGDTQKIRADLKPPKEGVKNLKHTISENGTRTMTYTYQGEEYFTRYTPSDQKKNCFDFKQKTISNGGKVESGTFCRGQQPIKNKVKSTLNITKPKSNGAKLKLTVASGKYKPSSNKPNLKLDAWSDNWFAAYIGEDLLIEDSVPITTERSFNAESIEFSASYPIQLNLILKDFKQNDSGLEYVGAKNQQMGDGGFILQVTDTEKNKVVAISNNRWKCEVLHKAPLNKLCEKESSPVAGEGFCTFISKDAPINWMQSDFNDSDWSKATEHSIESVGPKDGYDEIRWNKNAKLIWGGDLEIDNTLICRVTIEQPK